MIRSSLAGAAALLIGLSVAGFGGAALAQDQSGDDLAGQATNPAAALIQLQLQDTIIPSSQNSTGVANTAIIQPVYPFVLGPGHFFGSIIMRTTLPILTTPIPLQAATTEFASTDAVFVPPHGGVIGNERTTGLGDLVVLAVPTRKKDLGDNGEFFQWGPIVTATFPTATSDATGAGKLSLGPGLLVILNVTRLFNEGDSIQIGGFGYQQWSVAGDSERDDVSRFFVAPIVAYHFKSLFGRKGWYLGAPDDLWTYDFKQSAFTQVPLGAKFGKVLSIGEQPINVFFQTWYNAAKIGVAPNYTMKINVTFLFPM